MNKILLTMGAAMLAASVSARSAEACGEVTITDMDWASAQVTMAVSKFLMEEGYGCTVVAVPSSSNAALVSLAENGTPDIVTEIWSGGTPAVEKLQAEGKALFHAVSLSDGGQQGWWVPQYLVDEHPELATLEGVLANADLLGNRFHSCPDGWRCRNVNANLAKVVGLEEAGYEIFVPGSGETLATSLASAYADRAPWFGYYWAPTPLLGEHPMVMVDLGAHDEAVHTCNTQAECPTPGLSAYPRDIVWTVVTPAFVEREPEVAEFWKKLSFTNPQMGDVLAWKDANNATADEAAAYFLTKYKDVWAGWLSDEAKAKLAPMLQ